MEKKLLAIKDAVFEQTKDRSKYFSVSSITEPYAALKELLDSLTPEQLIEYESQINDCVLLFSLAFMTVGLQHVSLSLLAKSYAIKSMLVLAMGELSITPKEEGTLMIFTHAIDENSQEDTEEVPEIPALSNKVQQLMGSTREMLKINSGILKKLPEDQQPLFVHITHIRRDVLASTISPDFEKGVTRQLEAKLEKIKAHMESAFPSPSEIVVAQLHKTEAFLSWFKDGVDVEDIKSHNPEISSIFDKLQSVLSALDVMIMTRRWNWRCTDLYDYMVTLSEMQPTIMKLAGVDEDIISWAKSELPLNPQYRYQHLVKYMCRRAWVLMFKLLDSAEPVSEALSSIYNQLVTMKRCLLEVKNAGGISNMRELYPFQLKLTGLDALREDGKFVVDGEVPPGQGAVITILAECFDMVYEMKVELDERGEEDGDSILVDDGDDSYSDEEECKSAGDSDDDGDDDDDDDDNESVSENVVHRS